jgi:hypothetical protein
MARAADDDKFPIALECLFEKHYFRLRGSRRTRLLGAKNGVR